MPPTTLRLRRLSARMAATALIATTLTAGFEAADRQTARPALSPGERSALAPPVPPIRRAPSAAPAAPPDLPPGAAAVRPSTLTLVLERRQEGGAPVAVRQSVTRTVDRVHIAGGANGPEWLFERNPVDPRRVSGHYVDHQTRTIVFHTDSDLALRMGIPGWAHVLTLGCELPPPSGRPAAQGARAIDGVSFVRSPGASAWWNVERLLPAECTSTDASGATRLRLQSLRDGVEPRLLRLPTERFPAYRALDLADWLEGH